MNALKTTLAVAFAGSAALGANAALVDDYNADGPTAGYTATVILDNSDPGTSNTSALVNSGGQATWVTSVHDAGSVEQVAIIRDGLSLAVGEEVQVDTSAALGAARSVGLYVGGTAPTFNVREDYIITYVNDGVDEVFQRGFDGGSEYSNERLDTGAGTPAVTLFIARTGANTFESGFYEGATRNVIETLTPTTANSADFVGLYADVRGAGTLDGWDNLRVVDVPEPGSLALLGLGGLALLRRRRA